LRSYALETRHSGENPHCQYTEGSSALETENEVAQMRLRLYQRGSIMRLRDVPRLLRPFKSQLSRLVPFCPFVSLSLNQRECDAESTPDRAITAQAGTAIACQSRPVSGGSLEVAMEVSNGRGGSHGRFFFRCNRRARCNQASQQSGQQSGFEEISRGLAYRPQASRMPVESKAERSAIGRYDERLRLGMKKAPPQKFG